MRVTAILALGAAASASSITPVQKVLQMMGGMQAQGEKAMEDEAKIFTTYTRWVDDEATRLGFNIKTAASDIEKLTAFITKADDDVRQLSEGIAELDDLIAAKEQEKQEATDLRNSEHAEYVKQQADLAESVDAIGRAIEALKQQNFDRPQAMMLLQSMAVSTPGMRSVLAAFLQEKNDDSEQGAPAADAYQSQTGGIIEMLEGLLEKFQAELDSVEQAEVNKAQNFDMNAQQLTDLISHSSGDREAKAETKADTAAKSAQAKGDLAATQQAKATDEKTLADMESLFTEKSGVFKENQKVRQLELEALAKAIEIISAPNVADSYAGHVKFVQEPSFLQTHSTSRRVLAREQASAFLKKRARALSSKVLASMANQIAANPFIKVIDMIKSLLAKLKEEAAAEADHKAWCDGELKSNKLKRDKKTTESEKLMANIEELAATIETLGEEITTLIQEQEDLTSAMGEATQDRTAEKAENEATIADAAAGAGAVRSALVVLRNFYDAQSFVQQGQAPEMAAYSGMASAKGGVVGMLEVIVSDFVRLEAETKAAEVAGASEYNTFMADAKHDKEMKHKRTVKAKLEKDQTEFDKANAEKMLAGVNEELSKANSYYEQLKPECIEVHVSYEERVARRKEEIQSLKDAYKMLDQKSVE